MWRPSLSSFLTGALVVSLASVPAHAGDIDRPILGFGRLFTNDFIGDGEDRWHTGSYVISEMKGPAGTESLPGNFGDLLELRYGARILTPSDTQTPSADDRRFAGVLSFGLYSHWAPGALEFSAGAEVTAVGPMTGLDWVQRTAHETFDVAVPSDAVYDDQFGNAVYVGVQGEAARAITLTDGMILRPFIGAQVGPETLVRAGADLLIGSSFTSGILVRDQTTGLLYQTLEHVPTPGLSFLIGGDVTHTFSDVFLPASEGYEVTDSYVRLRAGMTARTGRAALFYGATWLGPEFEAQDEGQLLGALQLQLQF